MSSTPTAPLLPLTGLVPGNAQKGHGAPPVTAMLESNPEPEYWA